MKKKYSELEFQADMEKLVDSLNNLLREKGDPDVIELKKIAMYKDGKIVTRKINKKR